MSNPFSALKRLFSVPPEKKQARAAASFQHSISRVQYYINNNPRLLHVRALACMSGFPGASMPHGVNLSDFLSLNSDQRDENWNPKAFQKHWVWIQNAIAHWEATVDTLKARGHDKKERKAKMDAIAKLLANPAFCALINYRLFQTLRKAAKSLEFDPVTGERDLFVKTLRNEDGKPIGLSVEKANQNTEQQKTLKHRKWKHFLMWTGRILGFIVALSCGFVTGVSVWQLPIGNMLLGGTAFLVGAAANFFLFFGKTPMVLINLFSKPWKRSIFKGLKNDWQGIFKKAAIIFSIILALGTAISMSFLAYFSINKAFSLLGLVDIATHVFAGALGVATFFGIFAMMFNAMSSLIRLSWSDIKLGLDRIYGRPPGMGRIAHGFKMVLTTIFTVLGLIIGGLSAAAVLGVMHGSALNVLVNTFHLVPKAAALAATVVVYGICFVPRMLFNLLNTVKYLARTTAWLFFKVHHLANRFAKAWNKFWHTPYRYYKPLDKVAERSAEGKKPRVVSVGMAVAIIGNALGNAALTFSHAGATLVTHIINAVLHVLNFGLIFFGHSPAYISEASDAFIAAGVGFCTSGAVNWNASRGSYKGDEVTSDALLRLCYEGPGCVDELPVCGWKPPVILKKTSPKDYDEICSLLKSRRASQTKIISAPSTPMAQRKDTNQQREDHKRRGSRIRIKGDSPKYKRMNRQTTTDTRSCITPEMDKQFERFDKLLARRGSCFEASPSVEALVAHSPRGESLELPFRST